MKIIDRIKNPNRTTKIVWFLSSGIIAGAVFFLVSGDTSSAIGGAVGCSIAGLLSPFYQWGKKKGTDKTGGGDTDSTDSACCKH